MFKDHEHLKNRSQENYDEMAWGQVSQEVAQVYQFPNIDDFME